MYIFGILSSSSNVSKLFGDHHHHCHQRFNVDAQTSTRNSSSFFGNSIFKIFTHERVYRQVLAIDHLFLFMSKNLKQLLPRPTVDTKDAEINLIFMCNSTRCKTRSLSFSRLCNQSRKFNQTKYMRVFVSLVLVLYLSTKVPIANRSEIKGKEIISFATICRCVKDCFSQIMIAST